MIQIDANNDVLADSLSDVVLDAVPYIPIHMEFLYFACLHYVERVFILISSSKLIR